MRLLKSFFLSLLILPALASAGYTTMTLEGVKQVNGVWTAAGVMDSMGFVRTTGAVTVSGTSASTAVALAVERNLAKATFKNVATKLGPYGVAAAGAYEVYDWLSKGDGTSPQLVPCEPNSPIWCHPADASGYDDSYKYGTYYEACNGPSSCMRGSTAREACDSVMSGSGVKISSITTSPPRCNLVWAHNGMPNGYVSYGKNNCNPNISVASCKFEIDPNKPKPVPISGDYFNSFPDPSLPVMADGFNKIPALRDGGIPISSTKFNPYSEWLGDPYFKDGQWWRDRMDVSPSPQPGQPNRVRVDIGPVKIEGQTNPNVVPDTGHAGGGGTSPQPEKEKATFCEANPMSIACVELGKLEEKPLEVVELPVNVTYTPWGASNAQCPSPITIPLWGGDSISVTYQPVCDFVTTLRPLIIALAFFIAGLIITGYNFKKGGE